MMLTETQLNEIVQSGEDTQHQFKEIIDRAESLEAEFVAMSNSGGGYIFVGVTDSGEIKGLTSQQVHTLNQFIGNAAALGVRPPIHPVTQNIKTAKGIVVCIKLENGINKPYVDKSGRVWVRNGADKRHVTAREELQRIFQKSALVQADILPLPTTGQKDLDQENFRLYVDKYYSFLIQEGISYKQLQQNMWFMRDNHVTIAGMLLFGKVPQLSLPSASIKAIVFAGESISDTKFLDTENIEGRLIEQYKAGMSFLKRNLFKLQGEKSFNSQGNLEIDESVLEELLVNALVHRDYLIQAPTRLFIFTNRIEIISPGTLPEHLTTELIKLGSTLRRNPVIAQHAERLIPYRGVGSGILRVLQKMPTVMFENDSERDEFRVVIPREDSKVKRITSQEVRSVSTSNLPKEIVAVLLHCKGEMSRQELQDAIGLKGRATFQERYLKPALQYGVIGMKYPDKPRSKNQRYRLTEKGEEIQQQMA